MQIFFIIGACGVGKSTLVPLLEKGLPTDFEIHDFDERGVPANVDIEWRQSELLYWLTLSKQNLDKKVSTIICGFVKPDEIIDFSKSLGVHPVVCLLHVDKEHLASRLLQRYSSESAVLELLRTTRKSVEDFVQNSIYTSSLLSTDSKKHQFFVVDTSKLAPAQVCAEAIKWIQQS